MTRFAGIPVPIRSSVWGMLALLMFGAESWGAQDTSAPIARHRVHRVSCSRSAAILRERLEAVVEASIDGHPILAAPAADHVQAWWARHAKDFRAAREADSLLVNMGAAARDGKPLLAARAAVLVATASLDWCPNPPSIEDRLMCIDLLGMAAWLRAHGVDADNPAAATEAASALASELRSRGKDGLVRRLTESACSAAATRVADSGDAVAASALLDLVDEIEKAVR